MQFNLEETLMKQKKLIAALLLALPATAALADITVGVTVSATGPAASLGIPEKNTIALVPTTIAGQKVKVVVLDDASDTTTAVKNAKKFVSEDKVDVIVGSTITPASLAMIDVAAESETPMVSMAASARSSIRSMPSAAGCSRHRRTMRRCRPRSPST